MKAASLFFLILSVLCYLLIGVARAQVPTCGASVPFYTADMTGMPHGTWYSPNHSRKGTCCTSGGSDRCTSFRVITDTAAVFMKLEIVSGAIPSGALYFQIGCGAMIPMGTGVWLPGGATYDITFCKPGNNANVYAITWYSAQDTMVVGNDSAYTCGQTDLDIGVTGGVWSSSNTSVATVDASTGVVSGISAGTTIISYVLDSVLTKTVTVTINPTPPITGTFTVCVGGTTALSNAATGGTWSSSNTAIATVGSTGVVTGVSTGTSTITYDMGSGCTATAVVTVNQTVPAITGGPICVGFTTTMANATAGGTWTSGSPGVATVNSSSGLATGVSSGTANITYTIGGGCRNSGVLTVNPLPAAITGSSTGCVGSTTTLDNSTSGGTWSSSNGTVATIGSSSGVLTGIAAGTTMVTYTTAVGCRATKPITINPSPVISGLIPVCEASTISLSANISGGTWNSANGKVNINSATGVTTGVSAGTVRITYRLPTGCMDVEVATVNAFPAAISGASAVCRGSTITQTDATAGGTWSSSNGSVVTIGASSGVLSGIAVGTALVSYTTSAGCSLSKPITVNPVPVISTTQLCMADVTTLSGGIAGGTWTSSNTAVAIVDSSSGIATAIATGTSILTYQLATGCKDTRVLTVNPVPAAIAGTMTMCQFSSVTLSNASTGGTWSSANPATATVNAASGAVTGVSAGQTYISYVLPTGCWALSQVTVNATPVISGIMQLCIPATTSLNSSVAGGTWSSSNTGVATIGSSSGVATAVAVGISNITYQLATGCMDIDELSVGVLPTAITGSQQVCTGNTTTLSNAILGGTWTSSDGSVATIGSTSGVVAGVAMGTTSITYTTAGGCRTSITVTVDPTPVISGASQVCEASTITLSSSIAGGTWISANTGVATIGSTSGVLSGMAAGTSWVTYTTGVGCQASNPITVNALPVISPVPAQVCVASTVTFNGNVAGGTWSSGNAGVATIGSSSGVASGVSVGTAAVTYQLSTGCKDVDVLTVNPQPAAISGPLSICGSNTVTLSDATDDGTWSSKNTSIATVDSLTGIVTGVSTGQVYISYILPTGCWARSQVTVNTMPVITNADPSLCVAATITMNASMAGGTWSSNNIAIAPIDVSSGVVTGMSAGNAIITYQLSSGCMDTAQVAVGSLPVAISGAPTLCSGASATYTNSIAGGNWTCSDTSVGCINAATGLFNCTGSGTTNIMYATAAGCSATKSVTVNPRAAITGPDFMCIHLTAQLASSMTGGAWSSSIPDTASVDASGLVTGLGQGTVLISYTTAQGCVTTKQERVNNYYYPLETQPLSTPMRTNICLGNTLGLNSDLGGDGHWTTSDTTKATVTNLVHGSPDPWGVVHALALGTVTISYTASNGCTSMHTITINPMPVITSTPPTICRYGYTTLNATPAGGQWISHQLTICQVTSWTGVVHASTVGVAEIAYRLYTYDQCGYNILCTVNICTPKEQGGAVDPESVSYSIYPNPGSGAFTISQDVIADQSMNAVVTNCVGQAVYNGKISFIGGVATLDLPNVSPGIYMVQLDDKPEGKTVLRVAVQ